MHASTGNYKQLQEDFRNGPYHVYNHHDHCNATFCKATQKKHQCPTSSSDVSTSTTIVNSPSQPSTLNVIVDSPSQPSTSNVIVDSPSQPSTSNVTINLSSQQSTSPLESETLLDQVAQVVAQDCEQNSEEHESRTNVHDHHQNTQTPAQILPERLIKHMVLTLQPS